MSSRRSELFGISTKGLRCCKQRLLIPLNLIFLASIAIAVGTASPALSPPISATPDNVRDYAPPNSYTPAAVPNPWSVAEKSSDEAKEAKRSQDEEKTTFLDLLKKYETLINVLCASVVAIFTGILTVFTVKLWQSGEKHSERELRAYVWVSLADIRAVGTRHPILGALQISNGGQTPAYQLSGWSRLGDELNGFVGTKDRLAPCVVGPGGHVFSRPKAGRVLNEEEFRQVVEGTLPIYVSGELFYTDSFSRKRFTRFRMVYNGDGIVRSPDTPLGLDYVPEGNDSN